MIYLDNGATTLHKPPTVEAAMRRALRECGNPGRGGHPAAAAAGEAVYRCRELAGALFHTPPERVTFLRTAVTMASTVTRWPSW